MVMDIKTNDRAFCSWARQCKGEVCKQQLNVLDALMTKTSNTSLSVMTQWKEQCGQQAWPDWKNGSMNIQIPAYNTN